jgi:uncharacterized SAM-binding protein YcdF (DUF218 family)
MSPTDFFVLTFDSTHHAIRAENLLKKAGLDIDMIPTPRDITSNCGLSIKFSVDNLGQVRKVLNINPSVMRLYRGMKLGKQIIYFQEEM